MGKWAERIRWNDFAANKSWDGDMHDSWNYTHLRLQGVLSGPCVAICAPMGSAPVKCATAWPTSYQHVIRRHSVRLECGMRRLATATASRVLPAR